MSSQNNDTFNEVKEIGIDAYLARQQDKSLLRMLTCGSVDDGKSTLIGRLLHDSHQIYEDQLAALHKDNEKVGNAGEDLDLALLVDGLQAEREQGQREDAGRPHRAALCARGGCREPDV